MRLVGIVLVGIGLQAVAGCARDLPIVLDPPTCDSCAIMLVDFVTLDFTGAPSDAWIASWVVVANSLLDRKITVQRSGP